MSTETNPAPYPVRFAKLVQEAESALAASRRSYAILKVGLDTWKEIIAILETESTPPRVIWKVKKWLADKTNELAEAELLVMDAMARLEGFEEVRQICSEALGSKPISDTVKEKPPAEAGG